MKVIVELDLFKVIDCHKFLSDVTGCRKIQESDCTSFTVIVLLRFEGLHFQIPHQV